MWFRWFVLLRLPISVVMLLGLGTASGERWTSEFGAVCAVAALAFLGAVSIKLLRRMRGALLLADWLLALELVGAVLLVGSGDYMVARHVDVGALFACGCAVGLLWTLPNGLVLHSQRGRFTEKKVGLVTRLGVCGAKRPRFEDVDASNRRSHNAP